MLRARALHVGDSRRVLRRKWWEGAATLRRIVGTALPVCRTALRRSADPYRSIQLGRVRHHRVNLCLDVTEAASTASRPT